MCMPEKNEENNVRTNLGNPADDLRKFCENLKDERISEIRKTLEKYFEEYFLSGTPRPWRAITGKRKCRPIPIYRSILYYESESIYSLKWPNISKEIIYKELENLGFNVIVDESEKILLTIDPLEKGEKLTFAQEWLKKINHNYSMYCAGEIKLAKELYPQYIEKLIATPKEKIEIYEDYTLFRKFCMNMSISRKCVNHLEKMLKAEGIEEVMDENRKYIGVKVLNIEELTKDL